MPDTVIVLCATARLARGLQLAHGRDERQAGHVLWSPLRALTLSQWLAEVNDAALLRGEIPAARFPARVLGALPARLLWERVIREALADDAALPLFDAAGMAEAAMEADALLLEWRIAPPQPDTEEARQFLLWREAYEKLCVKLQALDVPRLWDRQVEWLRRGAGALPPRIMLAGFDRVSPQLLRLLDVLRARQVEVAFWPQACPTPASARQIRCEDSAAECRAAVAWVRQCLEAQPQARLGIMAPELGRVRAPLSRFLDDVLHPETLSPENAEIWRRYDFSLGEPLLHRAMVAGALRLLRFTLSASMAQQDVGLMLRDVYWSLAAEADARALLEARMRRELPATLSGAHLLRLARKAGVHGLVGHLEALHQQGRGGAGSKPPSAWARVFSGILDAAGWPGERSLSSHEYQTRQAWDETLESFAGLDDWSGRLQGEEALRRMEQMCRERIFQPEAPENPQVLVMGMLETVSEPLDGLWVMGMNDHQWPLPPHPNPLLPAEAQRRADAPNSCHRVQAAFAETLQQRLLHSAATVIFSWAERDGERTLRPSPFLEGLAPCDAGVLPVLSLAEAQVAQRVSPEAMEWVEDSLAPPVADGEVVGGGTGLLRAQAACPAWAYYRYRLGARALEMAEDGLDSKARGSVLHGALQQFWQDRRSSGALHAMTENELQEAIQVAATQGLQQFERSRAEPFPAQFAALEHLRLRALLATWLTFEKLRGEFEVVGVEQEKILDIAGIAVKFVLDRIDRLPDGRWVVIDYKTSQPSCQSWADVRITEPQLPIYAAIALAGEDIAAVCFGQVRLDECKWIGVAQDSGLLPGVKGLGEMRRTFPEGSFPDWGRLMQRWDESIRMLAQEVCRGEAQVCFDDEKRLAWCEVKPLLRLPERAVQWERARGT